MKYYKVPPELDNTYIYKRSKRNGITIDTFLVGGEIYTENEVNKMYLLYGGNAHVLDRLTVVEVPKNQTYYFFGARFEV